MKNVVSLHINIHEMSTIKLKDKCFRTYLKEDEILKAIDGVAEKINGDFRGCSDVPVLLCVLNGAVVFASELMRRLDFDFEFASLKIRSYEGTHSTGKVSCVDALNGNLEGRRVIVCEDIVDSGNSMEFLRAYLKERGASDIRICSMLFKPEMFRKDFKVDYYAMSISNEFIVGFGLDYDELGRGLRDIYIIK